MSWETLFQIVNLLALLAWIPLFVIPRHKLVVQGLPLVISAALGVTYVTILVQNLGATQGGDFRTLAGLQEMLDSPQAMLVGWIHYLAFDLFVGSWIAWDSGRRGIALPWTWAPLLFTFMLGPFGLLLHILVRSFHAKRWGGAFEDLHPTSSQV